MPVLKQIIDVITMKSDRPVRRLLAYYAIVAVVVAILAYFFSGEIARVAAKGLGDVPEGPTVLTDALASSPTASVSFGPGTLLDVALTTTLILIGALVLILPVTWVYMSARPSGGHDNRLHPNFAPPTPARAGPAAATRGVRGARGARGRGVLAGLVTAFAAEVPVSFSSATRAASCSASCLVGPWPVPSGSAPAKTTEVYSRWLPTLAPSLS